MTADVHLRSWATQVSVSVLLLSLLPSAIWCQLLPSCLPSFSGNHIFNQKIDPRVYLIQSNLSISGKLILRNKFTGTI